MILKTLFGTTFALGLTTFATAGYVSIASIAGVETVITESANTDRNPEDMASFVTAVTDAVVLFDNSAEQHYSDPDIRYQKHIGLGFAISMTNINPLKGGCSGNGQFGDSLGNNREYTLDGSMGCGEPSPAD